MTLKIYANDTIDPQLFKKRAKRAAHAVAVMAEHDMQPLVPAASGRLRESAAVDGRKVTWGTPYVRTLYYGTLMVDPKYNVGGFPFPNYGAGVFRSRRGVKKVRSGRKLTYRIGEANWILEATTLFGDRWIKMARKELARNGGE